MQLHRHCDPDWVSFDATAGTAYVLETRDLQGVADTILEVYDTDGTTVLTSNDDYNGTLASHVEWTAPANGTYFARVGSFGDQYGGERSYSLDVRLAAQAQCVADADCAPGEICDQGACVPNPVRCAPDANEEDDDVASARVLTVDRQFAGLSFCDDATDFISFDATAGQVYDAQTFNLSPGADTILELYDADGVTLLASNDDDGVGGGLASLIQGWTAPATATYYVLVRSYGDAFGPDRNYSVGVRESCVDDAFENDDNASIAHAVAVDAPAEAHKHCQDEDWIGFQATAGTNYVLETSALVGADDTLIGLYDGTGALLASDDDGNGNLASRLAWQAPADGTYYLRIGAWSEIYGGARGYSVRVSTGVSCNLNANCPAGQVCVAGLCGPAPVGCAVDADCGAGFTCVNTVCVATPRCQADANEEDDAVAQAHPLTVGRPLTLNHCDDALDAFSFDATAGQLFDFQTSGLGASADTIIHVIGTDGVTELTSDDDGGGGRASLVTGWVAPADGTYYVTVTSFQNAFGDAREYTFIARETCTDDAYEEDDTAADGRLVALGTPQDHAFCADADWLRFNGVAGRAVRIETSNLVGGADTIVDVYDVDGVTMLDSNDDGAGNLASLLVFTPAANGVYGVRVHSYGDLYGGARAYTVSITDNAGGCTVDADCAAGEICQGAACIPAPPRCAADGNEEDDTSADAKLLGVGHDVRLNFCDDGGDWLAFDAVAGESYDIVTFNLDAVGRTDTILELVDTDGATVLRRDDDGAGDGLASLIAAWSAPAAGRYYVHVVSFLGRSGNDIAYSVGIRSACTDDLYEQDDRSATAGNFTPGDPIQDRKLCEDEDWVQFGALAGHGYRIETLNLLGGADTLIALFDTNGVQLGSDDDANGNLASRLDWRAPADGNYFVQIANFGAVYGGQRAYQFRITEIAAAGICAADADCGAGQLCVSGQCVRGPNGCAVDADCPAGLSCVNGQCAAVAHCVPDSNEEDDALAQAHFLAVGHAIALNFCDDATDWLAVDLVAGQSYDLYTGGLEGATDTIITLFDAAQTQLATNDDADASGRRDSLIAGFVAPATATYYLAVSSYRGAAGDALSYTVGVVESCNDDVFEDDDTTVESHAFAVGAGAEAHALCRDNDFVSLAATAGRTYTIVTGNLAVGTDTILEVYDVDGVTVLQSNDDVGGALNSGLRFVAPATATYFVRVLSFGENYGGTRAYALNIVAGNGCLVDADCGAGNTCNVGVCGAVLNCNPDTFEEDDTFQAANVTGIGASGDHNFCEDANDWLSFAAVAGQAYDFQTYNLGDQTDTILELYDADGVTQLLSDDDGAADGTASLISNWTAPANATYYVRVGSYQNDQGASHEYTVNVHNHCVDDAFEHDNNPNQAHVFGNGVFGVAETHALCANEDWLRFDTVAGAVYTIQTSNLQGGADTTLYLVDTDGVTALLYDDDGAGGRASLIANWTAPTTGTYFVRVGNYDEIYGGPRTYDVNITRR